MQIARTIFLEQLSVMKQLIDLLAFKMDKRTGDYKYMKSQVMDYFYEGLKTTFKKLSDEKIIEKCECKHSLRKGYSKCPKCSGAGWKNIETKKKI